MCCRDAAYIAQERTELRPDDVLLKPSDLGIRRLRHRATGHKGRNEMSWIVRYGGWTVYEGDDEQKAYEEYRACGPYGTIREVKE